MLMKDYETKSLREFAFSFRYYRGLFLAKLQAFIVNSCFGRLIKLILIQSVAVKRKIKTSELIEISIFVKFKPEK